MNENESSPRREPRGDGEQARAYVRENREHFTREAIAAGLRAAGYDDKTVAAAMSEFDAVETSRDLRKRASLFLVSLFGGTWLVITAALVSQESAYGIGPIASMILGVLLGIVLLASLAYVSSHAKLAAGDDGALVTALAVPVILWFAITGICVSTTLPVSR